MPITSFFSGLVFNQKDIGVMSMVFETVCSRLGINERTDKKMTEAVAKKIIELVLRDVHNTKILHEMTLLSSISLKEAASVGGLFHIKPPLGCRPLARHDRYCSASECRLSGEVRKWLERAQTDVDDPSRHFATKSYLAMMQSFDIQSEK